MRNNTSYDSYAQRQSCSMRSSPNVRANRFFCNCSLRVLALFAIMLAGVLGLILGTVFACVLALAIPWPIVLAVILGILVIGFVIFRLCMCWCCKKCD